jgi:hypothetical protein
MRRLTFGISERRAYLLWWAMFVAEMAFVAMFY